ncbi:MAG TPA: mandelate racemase/muconate lactonizing enzyme family protein [Beijerinckiaceae bacterium]|jgi:galactonate dehydratase|nr:mandelate racemase/muconate lactonizing enzyme family protein [Beijerinckiaceae bacterium]
MQVEAINVYLVTAGKLHPVIVEIITDEGITGIGEAAIAYGVGGTAAAGMVKDLSARIVGRDPSRIEELWSEMYDHSFWAKGGGAIVFAGISAIEQALWDIKGKALGVPVYELLGGRIRDEIRVYANGWYGPSRTPAELANAAERPLREGYKALKCYPLAQWDGAGLRHVTNRQVDRSFANLAFEKVRTLREAVGPEVELMLDLSGGLTTDETIRLCRRFEELDITWVEEPADPFDVGALKKISDKVSIPVAVGERLYTRHAFRKIFEQHAADIVQPDVGNTGGIMEVKKIAAMAEAYNMRVAPHNCATALSTAASLQIAACISNFMTQEIYPYFPERPGYIQVLEDSPEERIKDGVVAVPTAPGLGVALAAERLHPFLWANVRC